MEFACERGDSKATQCSFLLVVEYPEWLANVVPVPKKDGKILMALEDMEKTSFITEWGTYCYRIMPFGLKNAGATYQRAATTLFHDMMHRDVEVYVDDMIVKSRDRADHLAALQRFFERIRQFRLRLNPKKCTFGVTSGKFLGHIVVSWYRDICEPIFRLLRKNQPTFGMMIANMALGCMLAQLDDSGKERAIYHLSRRMLEYECKYIMIECLCLALACLAGRLMRWLVLLTEFDIQYLHRRWQLYFDGAANQLGFGIDILLISPQGDHIPRSVRLAFSDHRRLTNNIVEYEACITGLETTLGLGVDSWRSTGIPTCDCGPLLIKTRSAPAYCCLIGVLRTRMSCPGVMTFISSCYVMIARELIIVMFRPCLCRSSDERGSCRSLWLTYGMTYVGPKDYEDRLFLVDHGGRLLPVPSEVPRVPDACCLDYFTKWVEAAFYARLTAARVAKFIRLHIIYRYGVLHELISNRGVHFRGEVDTFIQEATPYSLVYGMEAVLPVEIEMRSLRVALEQQISKTEWALSHYDQLSCGPAFFTCAPTRSARLAFYL
ncbi:Retrovirus-related Pol polyprotein from transposon 297 [Vitis vinifera]|uniref:Retrovirus-related Pol polyprotein from transposon 297 n=1 Tax=Vitis vinifera TaxID=29760 RepID=A0A438IFL2_VITVI|nr:Retrovirus-related Pol polyprotein from transposon 297 [Vitis vinifera]